MTKKFTKKGYGQSFVIGFVMSVNFLIQRSYKIKFKKISLTPNPGLNPLTIMTKKGKNLFFYMVVFVVVVSFDFYTKLLIVRALNNLETLDLLPFLKFVLVHNWRCISFVIRRRWLAVKPLCWSCNSHFFSDFSQIAQICRL